MGIIPDLKIPNVSNLVLLTLNITIFFLFCNLTLSSILSFIFPQFRTFFLLQVGISLWSGFIYIILFKVMNSTKNLAGEVDWKRVISLRYVGWVVTTQLLLISLCLFLYYGNKVSNFTGLLTKVMILDFIMISIGYLGDLNYINDNTFINNKLAAFISFAAMFSLFYLIYEKFFINAKKFNSFNFTILSAYFILWLIYGITPEMSSNLDRNLVTNIIDCLSKSIIGLAFGIYIIFYYKTLSNV
jgi:bacteriorhodopsin